MAQWVPALILVPFPRSPRNCAVKWRILHEKEVRGMGCIYRGGRGNGQCNTGTGCDTPTRGLALMPPQKRRREKRERGWPSRPSQTLNLDWDVEGPRYRMTLVKIRADSSIMQARPSSYHSMQRTPAWCSRLADVWCDHHWMLCVPVHFMP